MSTKNLLLIFTKNPELGKVKTRLAKTIGDERALTVYKALLKHTHKTTKDLDVEKHVYYSNEIVENDLWKKGFKKYVQEGEDLGIRMKNAFLNGFAEGYENIVIIGSDMFAITENHLKEAFEKLNSNSVVIGPAEDGGYYLLGMQKDQTFVLDHKEWSTESVFPDTVKDIQERNLSFDTIETLNDIDTEEDLMQSSDEVLEKLGFVK
ncbi:TIGR04282 family arsenosugar biosynthesis glycosyltransferase [Aureivirga sp. CE67]|uniref:TIGR04282 family arsenosugar biosynthesis glycosyltransferase n=1 Tax=Aureivirga sp. CE67 TaxID=1788983 RepID=UPI0018C9F22F|nr:TIGR04282 family arsenosugar biosynthesis glycosyltransferase [Aureivirga sp. CE67]